PLRRLRGPLGLGQRRPPRRPLSLAPQRRRSFCLLLVAHADNLISVVREDRRASASAGAASNSVAGVGGGPPGAVAAAAPAAVPQPRPSRARPRTPAPARPESGCSARRLPTA